MLLRNRIHAGIFPIYFPSVKFYDFLPVVGCFLILQLEVTFLFSDKAFLFSGVSLCIDDIIRSFDALKTLLWFLVES